jgi:hypothetical protein
MEKAILQSFIDRKLSLRRIAAEVGKGVTTIRYWARKYNLTPVRVHTGDAIICKLCNRVYNYDRDRGHTWDTCNSCWQAKRRREQMQKAVAYKGGKCISCDYHKSIRAMDFHHRDPATKEFEISAYVGKISWEDLVQELDKCDLLCANCHREIIHTDL